MLVELVLLGTWPAILALLERRGRLPQHTYLDYSFTNFLTAVIIALTLGQIGEAKPHMPNFLSQLSQNNWPSVLIAMAGGAFLAWEICQCNMLESKYPKWLLTVYGPYLFPFFFDNPHSETLGIQFLSNQTSSNDETLSTRRWNEGSLAVAPPEMPMQT